MLELGERGDEIHGFLEFNTDLFEGGSIDRMVSHFQRLLESVAEKPDARLSKLALLTEEERQRILVDWNQTEKDYPSQLALHQLFERQVDCGSDRTAVVFERKELTYRELEERSNRLAHRLREMGAGPDTLIGLYAERSSDTLVALLGILKSGAAYLPLDPEFPVQRIKYMLEDASVRILLSQRSLTGGLPRTDAEVLYLDDPENGVDSQPEARPEVAVKPQDLAYVIYTSGSTGRPKGVQIAHGSVVNFLDSMLCEPGLSKADVFLAVTTLSFDISVLELFLPLACGARVVVAPRRTVLNAAKLGQLARRCGATVMQATPSTWRLLLEAGWPKGFRPKILCGGEALPPELAASLLGHVDSLWNMYGPTETTIWSTIHRVTNEASIPIGKPIANTSTYVLDAQLQPVPIGVPGELYIGGVGLARGYLSRPELTAQKFVPDPFSRKPAARMYRTGDRVRFLSDGTIDFLGRIDNQIKLRGFRIELGEIEMLLNQHPSIKQSVALVREDRPGDRQLVAYVTSAGGTTAPAEWRDHLRENLPYYMIPSVIVPLDEFPLTPSGKIDRKSLPSPDRESLQQNHEYRAPIDEIERHMAKLWGQVLNLEKVSVRANFFEIGGHSLLAAELFTLIEGAFSKRIPLAALFQRPTIEELAQCLRQDEWSPDWASLVPITAGGSRPPLFLVHGAGGNVLLYRDLANRLGADQPVYGLQAHGLDGLLAPLTRIEDMAERYVTEVRTLQPEGPYHLGGYCLGGVVALEMARRLMEQGEEVALVAMLETYNAQTLSARAGSASTGAPHD